jgi:histidinol phosphatase-like enzyme
VIGNVGEALATETQALFQAIMIAEQFGIGRPLFTTDCQVLLKAVTSKPYDSTPLGAMF